MATKDTNKKSTFIRKTTEITAAFTLASALVACGHDSKPVVETVKECKAEPQSITVKVECEKPVIVRHNHVKKAKNCDEEVKAAEAKGKLEGAEATMDAMKSADNSMPQSQPAPNNYYNNIPYNDQSPSQDAPMPYSPQPVYLPQYGVIPYCGFGVYPWLSVGMGSCYGGYLGGGWRPWLWHGGRLRFGFEESIRRGYGRESGHSSNNNHNNNNSNNHNGHSHGGGGGNGGCGPNKHSGGGMGGGMGRGWSGNISHSYGGMLRQQQNHSMPHGGAHGAGSRGHSGGGRR